MTAAEMPSHYHLIYGLRFTSGSPGPRLAGQADGNTVIYGNGPATARWAQSWYTSVGADWNQMEWGIGERYSYAQSTNEGGSVAHNNMQPYMVVTNAIRL